MIRAILCDIEGTTTSIAFAHEVLFPLSLQRMESFILKNHETGVIANELRSVRLSISETKGKGQVELQEVIEQLKDWIREDRKEGALKSIQGKIWREAFESGLLKGHVYSDVPVAFRRWRQSGIRICIFSSGSVEAQKLIFRYSEAGDLTHFIEAYFDTTTGNKRDAASYRSIAGILRLSPDEILFLSDVTAELDAAGEAGMMTIQLIREETQPAGSNHKKAFSFDEIPAP